MRPAIDEMFRGVGVGLRQPIQAGPALVRLFAS